MAKHSNNSKMAKDSNGKSSGGGGAGARSVDRLYPFADKTLVRAIVENPKGSKDKYKYDTETGLFECGATFKGGMTFPFDFGFIPSTRAEDGDPLDIVILMDQATFPGVLVQTRVIGVLEAEQQDGKRTIRNDRVIGVHTQSVAYGAMNKWSELPKEMRAEIEEFFIFENRAKDRIFKPMGWRGPRKARKLIHGTLIKPGSQNSSSDK